MSATGSKRFCPIAVVLLRMGGLCITGNLWKPLAVMLVAWALLFLSSPLAAQTSPHFPVTKFIVEGDNPLATRDVDILLAPFIGEEKSIEDVEAATRALQELLHKRGFTSHRVILPEQTLRDGIVKLRVIGFTVGEIKVTGNTHFSEKNILSTVPALERGIIPNTSALSRQLLLANEHPSKALTLTFQESETPRAIDATLTVTDERPYSLFAAFNNHSSQDTPDTRLTLGAQHSNLFDKDHILTATYTTSPGDASRVKQYGFDYRIPVYVLGGAFSAYYVRSDVDSGRVAGFFDVSGAGEFMGGSYAHHLTRLGRYSQSASVSVDDKVFENDVTFAGIPFGTDVRSRPLSLRYAGTYRFNRGTAGFDVIYAHNLPGGADNDDAAYAATRFNADQDWDAWRFGAVFDYSVLDRWRLRGRFHGQYSEELLIPGEQFGVGGAHSVRGYDERLVSGDTGFAASIEVWSPPIKYNVRPIAFIDGGSRRIHDPLAGESESDGLLSIGVGLRAFWERNLSLELDLARTLSDAAGIDAGHTRGHFSLLIRY